MPVKITGIKECRDAVTRLTQDISDVERKLIEWGERVDDLVRGSASMQQTPEGEPWEPRKTTTERKQWKAAPGNAIRRASRAATARTPDGGTLGIKSGKMLRSISVRVGRNKATLSVGSGGARYAKYFVGYSSRQPARPILPDHSKGTSSAWLDEWSERLADEAIEAFNRG